MSTKKYDVIVLHSHERLLQKRLDERQDEGWEIAGDILVKNSTGHCNDTYMMVPLKREKL